MMMEHLQTEVVTDMMGHVDSQPIIVPQTQAGEELIVSFDSLSQAQQANLAAMAGANAINTINSRQHSMVDLGKRLLHASRCGDVDQVRDLMANGAPFTTDWLGTSPLHFAAHSGHLAAAETLLRAGISRDAKTKVDRTPLHCACQEGHRQVAEILIKNGADVDAKDMLRMAPIHWAVERNHREVVELLLKHGADITAEDKFERTPIHIAVQNETIAIAHLLQNSTTTMEAPAGLNTSSEDLYQDTTVVEAAKNVSTPSTPLPIHHKRNKIPKPKHSARTAGETSVLATLAALAEATSGPQITKPGRSEDTYKWLSTHGISMAQLTGQTQAEEDTGAVLTLTEAGKLALNLVKEQGESRESAPNYAITTDENGQNVITIMTEQPLGAAASSSMSAVTASHKVSDHDDYLQPASKRVRLVEDVVETEVASLDSMDADELKRHLEEMQKQAREYRLQLQQKEREAETYKRKLVELKGNSD